MTEHTSNEHSHDAAPTQPDPSTHVDLPAPGSGDDTVELAAPKRDEPVVDEIDAMLAKHEANRAPEMLEDFDSDELDLDVAPVQETHVDEHASPDANADSDSSDNGADAGSDTDHESAERTPAPADAVAADDAPFDAPTGSADEDDNHDAEAADNDAGADNNDNDAGADNNDNDADANVDADDQDAADADEDGPVTFADLGLSDELLEALLGLGYTHPTPIQAESIPPLLDGFDLLGQAATGTGKTAAFALPMLDRVVGAKKSKIPFGLVLVPTRELANQVAEATKEYGANSKVRIAALFGGTNIGPQFSLLNAGVDIVIGTPGRVLDHLKRGSLDLTNCGMVVLDEADEMLDMGFAEDLEAILEAAPPERQTVLFSATMPNRIDSIANRQLSDPVRISIKRATDTEGTTPKVTQRAYLSHRSHRASALGRILDMESPDAAIVFCRTRGDVDALLQCDAPCAGACDDF
jgi:ATP-dependent RNA helicase DeaD